MCVKPALNPNADEWRPTQQQPPHLPHHNFQSHFRLSAAPPPPPEALQALAFASSPPQKLQNPLYCHSHPVLSYQGFLLSHDLYTQYTHGCQPFYYVSMSADHYGDETKGSPYANELTQSENIKSDEGKKMESPKKGPGSDSADFCKKRNNRFLPPRHRPVRHFLEEKKNHPPPPPNQVWKPKKPENPVFEVSSDGGASQSPAPNSPSTLSFSTVMIKNIPNELRRDFMLKFLDGLCKFHSLEYDFLYLPMDFRRKQNLGYAFLNLTGSDGARKFKNILEDYKWGVVQTDEGPINSKKICEITWARIQGKDALLRRFRNASFSCHELDFLPVVLDPPRNGSDPNPPPPVVIGRLCGHSY